MKFDESKVINGLHADKAAVGKDYYYADDIVSLKEKVESGSIKRGSLIRIVYGNQNYSFIVSKGHINLGCYLLYPAPNPFDESKIIDTLHADKAVVGRYYYYADSAHSLKKLIESGEAPIGKYTGLDETQDSFRLDGYYYYLLYPVD